MVWLRVFRASAIAVVLLAAFSAPAAAGDFRADDQVTVGRQETVDDDLYIGAGTVTIDGTVDGDVTVGAGTVTISGEITGSLNVGGGTVTVSGPVGGAVRAGAGTLTISGEVGRDVVVFGGTVTLDSGSRVAGDVAVAGGTLALGGQVDGDVLAAASAIDVTGSVDGSLDLAVDELDIASGAAIGGDVRYVAERDATIASDATIGGEVTRRDPPETIDGATALGDNPALTYLGALLGLLILGFGMLLLRPGLVTGSAAELRAQPLMAFLLGLGVAFAQIVLALVLLVAGVAVGALVDEIGGAFIQPAILVMLLAAVLGYLSQVPLAMGIGQLLLRSREGFSPYLSFAVGAALLAAILVGAGWLNGLLGAVLWIIGWLVGLGALSMHAWRTRNLVAVIPPRPPDPAWPMPAASPPAAAPPD